MYARKFVQPLHHFYLMHETYKNVAFTFINDINKVQVKHNLEQALRRATSQPLKHTDVKQHQRYY